MSTKETLKEEESMTAFTTIDGRDLFIRRVTRDDAALLVDMFYRLSEQTRRLRYHCASPNCPEELIWREALKLCQLGPEQQVALVAVAVEDNVEQAIGTARFVRSTPDAIEAEVGIVVRDDYQGVGLGTRLILQLLQAAHSMGIEKFKGWILPENQRMLRLVKKPGLPVEQYTKHGETQVVVSLPPPKPC
jgi:acetyltransferase